MAANTQKGGVQVANVCQSCGDTAFVPLDFTPDPAIGVRCAACGGLEPAKPVARAPSAPPEPAPPSPSPSPAAAAQSDASPDVASPRIEFDRRRSRALIRRAPRRQRWVFPAIVAAVIAVAVLLTLGAGDTDRTRIPRTPAGVQLTWLLDTLNDRAHPITIGVVGEHFAPNAVAAAGAEALQNELIGLRHRHAGYHLERIEPTGSDYSLAAYVTNETMEWGEVLVVTETDEPYRILRFTIGPAEVQR